ncbi:MAG TPA: hypothetical protein VM243_10515 [Phycisphaerae bacterium]|nr:hypothetical protein [Phycisphaerae bacterium]HUX00471.1 hypothetical protein [Phycisphaerae bacterium]
MDLAWCEWLMAFCERETIDFDTAVERLRDSETYLLAHSQFIAGASDRVLDNLLLRAAIEKDLVRPKQ